MAAAHEPVDGVGQIRIGDRRREAGASYTTGRQST